MAEAEQYTYVGSAEGWDAITASRYLVRVWRSEAMREVCFNVEYDFSVAPDRNRPVTETDPDGARWRLHSDHCSLHEEMILVLNRARIPLLAQKHTLRLIFDHLSPTNIAGYDWIGLDFLRTETTFDCYDPDKPLMRYDEEEEEVVAVDVRDGWDEATQCEYSIRVTRSYCSDVVVIDTAYALVFAPSDTALAGPYTIPYLEPTPPGGRWDLNEIPGGLSGLRNEMIIALGHAQISLAAQDDTIRKIFEDLLRGQRWIVNNGRCAVALNLSTTTYFVYLDGQPPVRIQRSMIRIEEDQVGLDSAVEASLLDQQDCLREKPARREAVEAVEALEMDWAPIDSDPIPICVICLDELCYEAIKMRCSHLFHPPRLLTWLNTQHFCPLCKFELPYVT